MLRSPFNNTLMFCNNSQSLTSTPCSTFGPTELNEMDLLNFPSSQSSMLNFVQAQKTELCVESPESVFSFQGGEVEQRWAYDRTAPRIAGAESSTDTVPYEFVNGDEHSQQSQQDYTYKQIYSVDGSSSYLTPPTILFPTPDINSFTSAYSPLSAVPRTPSTSYSPGFLSPWEGNNSSTPTTPLSMQSMPCFQEVMTSGVTQLTHQDQINLWKKARELPAAGGFTVFIPQRIYKPHTTSDIKRYVEEVFLDPPIFFWMEGPEECGISLTDALHGRTKRLRNRDKEVFEGRGPSVSIRLEWPGYRQWSRQIPTKDFKSPPRPISMTKLCKNVAKCVQRFISERQHCDLEDGADTRWRAGDAGIKLEDLVLVSLHHVSMGSWQPQLRLRKRMK